MLGRHTWDRKLHGNENAVVSFTIFSLLQGVQSRGACPSMT